MGASATPSAVPAKAFSLTVFEQFGLRRADDAIG
jgi:hypothetical protein